MPICHAIAGNGLWLDGGAMFGNVPRALWSRWCLPDAQGRIELATRCLLVEDGERRILLETGIGAFFEPSLRDRYGVTESRHRLLDSLRSGGWAADDIDVVVLSHLHFDHAGGLLTEWAADRAPALVFPRAEIVVGSRAFERARRPHPRDRASFVPGLVELLEASGRLTVFEGSDIALLGPSFELSESHGHTPGMLHTRVRGSEASLFYCADLIPGVPWIHEPVAMGYDRFPEQLVDEKRELLASSLCPGRWLFFTHDARVAAARVERTAEGRYRAIDARADFGLGFDLDRASPAGGSIARP